MIARALLRALAAAVGALPWRSLRACGALLGALVGSVLRIRRAHVDRSLARAGVVRPDAVARAMYASLGAGVCELLWVVGRPRAPLDRLVSLSPEAAAVVARRRGLGAVVATAHLGNWDLAACAVASAVPLTVVTKRLHVATLDRFWQGARAARGVRLVGARGALAAAREALAGGGFVAFVVDQAPERGSGVSRLPFLGAPALCDRAPAALAARARVPLVLALDRRLADGTHRVDVPLVLEPPPRAGAAWVEEATARVQRALEAAVLADPSQWLWMHRRWKGALLDARPGV